MKSLMLTLFLVVLSLNVYPSAAGAVDCGEPISSQTSVAMWRDAVTVDGPYTLAVPAGTYTVTMHSYDDQHAAGVHPGQVAERWFFTLGTYTSPTAPDLPELDKAQSVSVGEVELEAATEWTAFWAGTADTQNSVSGGFTLTPVCAPPTTTTTTTTLVPTTTVPAVTTTTTTSTTTTAVPSTTAAPTTTVVPTTTSTVPAVTETVEDELARTGLTANLGAVGLGLLCLGLILCGVQGRLARSC